MNFEILEVKNFGKHLSKFSLLFKIRQYSQAAFFRTSKENVSVTSLYKPKLQMKFNN